MNYYPYLQTSDEANRRKFTALSFKNGYDCPLLWRATIIKPPSPKYNHAYHKKATASYGRYIHAKRHPTQPHPSKPHQIKQPLSKKSRKRKIRATKSISCLLLPFHAFYCRKMFEFETKYAKIFLF
ncbi:MAG: hypothetical protein PUE05_08820 [bacterium]|nr:hypothetical protein [bacterium]